ncbi:MULTISPECIES: PTS fructose transporter subunit IIB [unclassified Lactobacillus]|uniref:PTS fructose transporter subunit IIB n=1 Tax=unclassified Lactobacillus TaxID=2620435 RepID=UPI000EFD9D92|nr:MULTISPECIES: fructose PTS transporter subunit IIB [unclassified Lactobacillus]RMC39176.1 PTS fructose transporter subunit IIB [Lactobacillus sp. ESL0237]RMC43459.1 PTS fructose transporter subunit IIB [Lactobacillus sp. ESL0234]RMC44372.1 PTS fructose transporter subunit IIB [Lactobacillus sp. ESL0236]RMC46808.1 PTS fructose transporter subunit IIB [Lactobacillus sp. ESL0230]RMC49471.1 PTS fructose transporter subunit IIB [Lactobacillus sp. ESL0225]
MKIVCVCACTSGIAHTYLAKAKLEKAAKELGYEIHIETQGTIGTENELTAKQIAEADVALLAVDIAITGNERFKNLPTVKVGTSLVVKAPKQLLEKIEKEVNAKKSQKA